jgi:hypothetical protein
MAVMPLKQQIHSVQNPFVLCDREALHLLLHLAHTQVTKAVAHETGIGIKTLGGKWCEHVQTFRCKEQKKGKPMLDLFDSGWTRDFL